LKIVDIKGSNANPLKPLRFRVRWQNSSPKHDTWEPLANVSDCQAFIDYVQARPNLWYLREGREDLHSNAAILAPLLPTHHLPISSARIDVIEQATAELLNAHRDSSYPNALAASETNDHQWHALAAGDMDDDGQELKLKKCLVGPDKDSWLKADTTEYHKLISEHKVMRPIKFDNIPANKKPYISYYNQQCKTKIKEGKLHYRVGAHLVETSELVTLV
jgi:hypothetical protein